MLLMSRYSKSARFLLFIFATLFWFSVIASAQGFEKATVTMQELYNYDKSLPLNATTKLLKSTDKYTLYSLEFDGTHGERVTALLSLPMGIKKPAPVVLFMHGYSGRKEDVAEGLEQMSPLGIACISIDAEYHGERKVADKALYSKLVYSNRDGMIQTINDFRRAIDYAQTRPKDFDIKRVGFIGGSMGGILGAVLTSVEPRIAASVLVVGGADWGYLLKASVVAEAIGLNKGDDKVDAKEFAYVIAPADPINWAHLISPRPVLMLNGKHDFLVNPKANIFLYNRLKAPKKIVWFNEGHALPIPIALKYTGEFFTDYLINKKNPAELGEVIMGHETTPLNMKLSKPLRAPLTALPVSELFQYDKRLPLKSEIIPEPKQTGKYRKSKVSFQTTHDIIMDADLYLPADASKGPFTPIVYVSELHSKRSDVKPYLDFVVGNGNALLVIDADYFGVRKISGVAAVSPLVNTTRDALIQNVINIRRAADFLSSLPEIKAAGGHAILSSGKYSARATLIARAVDNRFISTMLVPGKLDASYDKGLAAIKKAGKQKQYDAAMKPLDLKLYMPENDTRAVFVVGIAKNYIPGKNQPGVFEFKTLPPK